MRISFTGIDLNSKIKEIKQKQDKKIIENIHTKWDRKKCNAALFGIGSVAASSLCTPIITKQLLSKTNIKTQPISLDARIGIGILALGVLTGHLFNKIDEKKNTKLGDFAYMLFNGPKAKEKQN